MSKKPTAKSREEPCKGEIPRYLDNGSTQAYKLQAVSFRFDEESGVAVAGHATPKNLHALTPCQQMEYIVILEHCRRCDDVRCVLWTVTGDDDALGCSGATFRAGMDNIAGPAELATAIEASRHGGATPDFDSPPDMALKPQALVLWDFPKPCVVAVGGLAIVAMPLVLGTPRATQMMLGGDSSQVRQAYDWGFVNDEVHEVQEPAELFSKALECAKKLAAARNPTAVSRGKGVSNRHVRNEFVGWSEGVLLLDAQKESKL